MKLTKSVLVLVACFAFSSTAYAVTEDDYCKDPASVSAQVPWVRAVLLAQFPKIRKCVEQYNKKLRQDAEFRQAEAAKSAAKQRFQNALAGAVGDGKSVERRVKAHEPTAEFDPAHKPTTSEAAPAS